MILLLVATVSLFSSCFKHTHDSYVSCDITSENEYIIKWDVYPKAEGYVKVYISSSPDSFNINGTPIAIVPASDGVVELPTPNPYKRHYFLLNFNNCFMRVVGARASFVETAYAFRDLGGYSGLADKHTRWGMVFRSGTLDTLSLIDKERIKNIAPKTIIEQRDKNECLYNPQELGVENVIYMPVPDYNIDSLIAKIYKSEFRSNDARIAMQDFYASLIDNYSKKNFEKLFDILTDENNYPIIISSRYGKGFVDIATLFILASLNVTNDEIYEDYTWANQYFCKTRLIQKISHLPQEVREAVASIIHNNRKDIAFVINQIQRKYGSLDVYMLDSLNLTLEKREKIQKILLVKE